MGQGRHRIYDDVTAHEMEELVRHLSLTWSALIKEKYVFQKMASTRQMHRDYLASPRLRGLPDVRARHGHGGGQLPTC
jgi:hypothetical protein